MNEYLENIMRYTGYITRTGVEVGAHEISPEELFAVTETIKYNHMHFAEMPGNTVATSVIMPFFQYPLKNAI